MKLKWIVAEVGIFFLLICFHFCASQKIFIPEEPNRVVEYLAQVKSVDRDHDFNVNLIDEPLYVTDERIYMVLKVNGLGNRSILHWKWYNPQKELVRVSEPVVVNDQGKYLEYFVAWDSLENEEFSNLHGTWTVVVTLDEIFLFCKEFEILSKKKDPSIQ